MKTLYDSMNNLLLSYVTESAESHIEPLVPLPLASDRVLDWILSAEDAGELTFSQAELGKHITWFINGEDIALFLSGIDEFIPLDEITQVEYSDLKLDPLYDGAYEVTQESGATRTFAWKSTDKDSSLYEISGDWITEALNDTEWTEVASKSVSDSDGFMTDYTWYTNGQKHIFMFGDKELYEPEEDYADFECDTTREAQEWYDSYNGFEDEDEVYEDLEFDSNVIDLDKLDNDEYIIPEGQEMIDTIVDDHKFDYKTSGLYIHAVDDYDYDQWPELVYPTVDDIKEEYFSEYILEFCHKNNINMSDLSTLDEEVLRDLAYQMGDIPDYITLVLTYYDFDELEYPSKFPYGESLDNTLVNDAPTEMQAVSTCASKVMLSYQNANKWLDSIKEELYTTMSCPFFSNFIHRLAHTMPERFDKFGDILHTVNMKVPYPATEEIPICPKTIDDVFNLVFGVLDNIKLSLNEFIKVTDEDNHGMACSAETLLNDIEREYPMLFRLSDKWQLCNGDTVDFEKYVLMYVDHEDDLIESLSGVNKALHLSDLVNNVTAIYVCDDARDFEYEDDLSEEMDDNIIPQDVIVSEEDVQNILDKIKSCSLLFVTPRRKNLSFISRYNITDVTQLKSIIDLLQVSDYVKNTFSTNSQHQGNELVVFELSNVVINGQTIDNLIVYIKIDIEESSDSTVVAVSFHDTSMLDERPYRAERLNEELWDSSRVVDLVRYCDRKGYDIDKTLKVVCHQMKKEGSTLPSDMSELKRAVYAAYDELDESYNYSKNLTEGHAFGPTEYADTLASDAARNAYDPSVNEMMRKDLDAKRRAHKDVGRYARPFAPWSDLHYMLCSVVKADDNWVWLKDPRGANVEKFRRDVVRFAEFTESYNYSGYDVSRDLQEYLVTVVIGGTDGDIENGPHEPDWYEVLVSAMDENDAVNQVQKSLPYGESVTGAHLATEKEIDDWYKEMELFVLEPGGPLWDSKEEY